jgi:hypothetical protein
MPKCPFESYNLEALSHDFEGFNKILVQLDEDQNKKNLLIKKIFLLLVSEGRNMMGHKGIEICGLVHAFALQIKHALGWH